MHHHLAGKNGRKSRAVRAGVIPAAAKEIWQVPKKLNKLGEEKTSGDEICPMEVSKHGGFETSPTEGPEKPPKTS